MSRPELLDTPWGTSMGEPAPTLTAFLSDLDDRSGPLRINDLFLTAGTARQQRARA